MNNYKCPECGKTGLEEDGRSKSFHCLWPGCDLGYLRFRDYNKIAAAILNKPFNSTNTDRSPSSEYLVPNPIADKILELVYLIKNEKERLLKGLEKKCSKTRLSEMNKDGSLRILLDAL